MLTTKQIVCVTGLVVGAVMTVAGVSMMYANRDQGRVDVEDFKESVVKRYNKVMEETDSTKAFAMALDCHESINREILDTFAEHFQEYLVAYNKGYFIDLFNTVDPTS